MSTDVSFNEEQEKIVLQEYVKNGKGQIPVMKMANINLKQLKSILSKHNYKLRNRQEAIIAANKNRNSLINQDYFSKESENMAWIMGFIAADGSIEKNRNVIKIGLSEVDSEILEKIRKEFNLQSSVKHYTTSQGYKVCKIQWSSESHKKALANYGIIPQKTFNLRPPYELSRKYWKDYIRGFWDGDGSVSVIRNSYNTLEWQLVSATKEILQFIVDFFYEEYNIPKVTIHELKRTSTLYTIQYSTNSTKKIYDIFYDNPNCLFLKRKKDKYTKLVNLKK